MKTIFSIFLFLSIYSCFPALAQNNSSIDSLLNELKTAKEDSNKVKLMNNICKYYSNISTEEGLNYALQAIALAEKLKLKNSIIADTYNNLGIIYQIKSDYPRALENHFISLKLNEELRNKYGMGVNYGNIGNVYFNQSDFTNALEYYLNALMTFEELGNKRGIAANLGNAGNVYWQLKDYPKALEYNLKALKIKEEIGNKNGMALTLANIGNVYYEQRDNQNALENYLKALKLFEEVGNKSGVAGVYDNVGSIYVRQNNYSNALESQLKGLKLIKEVGNPDATANTFNNIGSTYLEAAKDSNQTYMISLFKGSKAEAYKQTLQLAEIYIDSAIVIHKDLGNLSYLLSEYENIIEIQTLLGENKAAIENYKNYILCKDSIFNLEKDKKLTQIAMQYEFDKKEAAANIERERKEKEIELLNKDNDIKALQLKQQQTALLVSKYEAEKNQGRILLLNKSNELQVLQLVKTQKDLAQQQAEAKAKAAELEVINKDKQLKEQQLEKQKLQRNGILAGAILILLIGTLFFRSMQLRKKLEKQQAVTQERKRISADLHDDIGSGLSKISLLSDVIKKEAKTPEAKAEAKKISETSLELSENISEIIWALNSNNDFLENLIAYIRRYAGEYFENSAIQLKIINANNIPHIFISGEYRRNIFYVVKEALHNIVKHAQATKAELSFNVINNHFTISIKDNGKGMPEGELNRFGIGMNNMRNRMNSINGDFTVENHQGTKIILSLSV